MVKQVTLNDTTVTTHSLANTPYSLTDENPLDKLFGAQDIELREQAYDLLQSHNNELEKEGDLRVDVGLLWSYRKVILLSALISLSGFLFGYDTGVIGGILTMKSYLRKFGKLETGSTDEYYLETYQTGLIVSGYHIGCILGGFTLARLADSFGRKKPISLSLVVYMIGNLIQISSVRTGKWYHFVVGRVVSGLCIGSVAVLAPMFISETAPTIIRGSCTFLYQLSICIAILTGYIVNYACKEMYVGQASWIVPLAVSVAIALVLAFGIFLAPESARYLVSTGDYDRARKSLHAVQSQDVEKTLATLKEAISLESNAKDVGIAEIFKKKYIKRVLIGVLLMMFNQMSGVDYFLYYSTTLFKSTGLNDAYVTSIILGTVNFAASLAGVYLIERFGRRKSLLWGAVASFTSLFIYSIVGTLMIDRDATDPSVNKVPGMVMIIFTCLFFVSFSPTWAACVSVLVSELYPIHIKAKAIAFGTAFNWGSNFFIGFCTPIITAKIGYLYGFVFTGFTFVAIWFVLLMIPETQGVSLEEIEALFEKN